MLVHAEDVVQFGVEDERLALLVWGLVQAPAVQETVSAAHLVQTDPEELGLHHLRLLDAHAKVNVLWKDRGTYPVRNNNLHIADVKSNL